MAVTPEHEKWVRSLKKGDKVLVRQKKELILQIDTVKKVSKNHLRLEKMSWATFSLSHGMGKAEPFDFTPQPTLAPYEEGDEAKVEKAGYIRKLAGMNGDLLDHLTVSELHSMDILRLIAESRKFGKVSGT